MRSAGDRFCRNCGLELRDDAGAIETYLAKVVPERIDAALKARFKDQKIVEVETAEKIAERAIGWLKTLGYLVGIPAVLFGAFLSFMGIKTYSDFEKASQKAAQFETLVAGAEKQFAGVQKRVEGVDAALAEAKTRIDIQLAQLDKQQQSLQAQVKGIEDIVCGRKSSSSTEQVQALQTQLSQFISYLERVGFRDLGGQVSVCIYSRDDPIEKYKSFTSVPNAFYLNDERAIYIERDLSRVLSVVLREYAHHALVTAVNWIDMPSVDEIESGLADYFAASFLSNPLIGDSLGTLFGMKTPYLRNINNDTKYGEADSEHHARGEVWSGALWRCRARLGQEVADKISLAAWTALKDQPAQAAPTKNFGAALSRQERAVTGKPSDCFAGQIAQRGLPH